MWCWGMGGKGATRRQGSESSLEVSCVWLCMEGAHVLAQRVVQCDAPQQRQGASGRAARGTHGGQLPPWLAGCTATCAWDLPQATPQPVRATAERPKRDRQTCCTNGTAPMGLHSGCSLCPPHVRPHPHTHLPFSSRHHALVAAHPSPLSASRGFFGCRHFSRANALLEAQGLAPIDWWPAA